MHTGSARREYRAVGGGMLAEATSPSPVGSRQHVGLCRSQAFYTGGTRRMPPSVHAGSHGRLHRRFRRPSRLPEGDKRMYQKSRQRVPRIALRVLRTLSGCTPMPRAICGTRARTEDTPRIWQRRDHAPLTERRPRSISPHSEWSNGRTYTTRTPRRPMETPSTTTPQDSSTRGFGKRTPLPPQARNQAE
jgi:hypothetical protein